MALLLKEKTIFYLVKNKVVDFKKCNLFLPKGNYSLQWIDPPDGRILEEQELKLVDGNSYIAIPEFLDDIVLRLKSIN